MAKKRDIEHRAAFESQGETYVRLLAEKDDRNIAPHARAWLGEQQALRDVESSLRRDEREEETLTIARKALVNSRLSNTIAIIAAIIAASAIIFNIIAQSISSP